MVVGRSQWPATCRHPPSAKLSVPGPLAKRAPGAQNTWTIGIPRRQRRHMTGGPQARPDGGSRRSNGFPMGGPDLVFIVREAGELLFENGETPSGHENLLDRLDAGPRERLYECMTRAFRHGRPSRIELTGLDGREPSRAHDCRVSPNYRDGVVVSATVAAHDITPYRDRLEALERELVERRAELDTLAADLDQTRDSIVEQRDARAAHEQEWRRFRALMDQAGEAIFISDAATECLVDANETACRWLRRPRPEVLGVRVGDLGLEFPILAPPESDLQFTETRDTRRPLVITDKIHRRSDGSTFPVEVTLAPHQFGDKRFVLAVAREIRRRFASEQTSQLMADAFRRLFEQTWDAVFLTGRGGSVEDANRAAVALFGYAPGELVGLDARQLFVDSHDIRRFQVLMSATGSVEDLEVRLRTKDGLTFPAVLSVTRRPSPDRGVRGYQCVVRPLAEPTAPAPATATDGTPTATVLLASRGADLTATRATLRNAGFHVISADAPDAAFEALRDAGVAVSAVVVDADLGSLRAVLQDAARHAPGARLVVLGSGDVSAIAQHVADFGAPPVLVKPPHPLALVQHVRGEA